MNNDFDGIWIGEKDLSGDAGFIKNAQNEIQNESLLDSLSQEGALDDNGANRRDFLKMMGFGLGAATVAAGCDIPVKRAIPYVIKPDAIVPGVASYYASSFVEGGDYCSILVKTREGRPIKIEGNDYSPITGGGTSARAQASVLSLYDVNRLREPLADGEVTSWSDLDNRVGAVLSNAKGIRLITNTVLSPTTHRVLDDLKAKYTNLEVITYDPVSSGAILEANEQTFGLRVIPDYHFDKADFIVSFNADFLGTWISPTEFARDYAAGRKVKDVHDAHMSRHIQVEAGMSLTGSNADNRILVKPSEQGQAIAYLYSKITGVSSGANSLNDRAKDALSKLSDQLKGAPGKSLIVSASSNTADQVLVNAINDALGNYGQTLGFDHPSLQRQGDEMALSTLVNDVNAGQVDVVIFHKCNPLYEHVAFPGLSEALDAVPHKIALSYAMDETASTCSTVAPVHHFLESWGDAEAKKGIVGLIQPTIHPLFNTRQAESSLLAWAGSLPVADQPYLEYLKKNWEENLFGKQSEYFTFQTFWDRSVYNGIFSYDPGLTTNGFAADISKSLSEITKPSEADLEIQFYESVALGNGQYANNPWLQEMPDPISRCAWGNYLAVPVHFDGVRTFVGLNKLKDGDLVDLTVNGQTYRVPVIQQFGQMKGTVSLALGYGRRVVGLAGRNVGVDVNPSVTYSNGRANLCGAQAQVSTAKGKEKWYSSVQYHHTMGVQALDAKTGEMINADEAATVYATYGLVKQGYQGSLVERSIIRHSHLDDLEDAVEELKHEREHHESLNAETLYPYEEYRENLYSQGHHWGMHVDLNACTGCGACTVACMAENNIPVVGKERVAKHQEMAWLRIDRYYFGSVENPNVVYQPMMCQHCDNAPCENVCPVNATNHSSEGLNQMTYNRCIGTRYCANNCPYKVRRFNWMDYTTADIFPGNQISLNGEEDELPYGADNLTRMVLNPDVTVRSRGVIEKCSFCVQRIQEGKLTAKNEGRRLRDADVRTACQTACPTGAITFGDQNNENGELADKFDSPLNMIVLEEINVRSSVQYTMKVHNRDESLEA